jgi:hypothetical protein
MSSIRSVTYHCTCGTPLEERILRCVAWASGIDLDAAWTGAAGSTSLVRTVRNALTNTSDATSGIGLMGALRLVAAPELWASSHAENAVLESWIYMVQQSIVPMLQQQTSSVGKLCSVILCPLISSFGSHCIRMT